MGKIFVHAIRVCSWSFWSLTNGLILRMLGSVGKGLKSEGVLYLPAIQGHFEIGDLCHLGPQVRLGTTCGAKLMIGSGVSINQGTFIICRESITIGNGCRIGEYVSIRDNDHQWRDANVLISEQGYITAPVVIEDDVWIGRGAAIQKGVKIGKGAVVGTNSVVTKNVDPYSVVAGVPAKVIKTRSN